MVYLIVSTGIIARMSPRPWREASADGVGNSSEPAKLARLLLALTWSSLMYEVAGEH